LEIKLNSLKEIIKKLNEEDFTEKDARNILQICIERILDPHYEIFKAVVNCIEILINYAESYLKIIVSKLLLIISLNDDTLTTKAKELLVLIKDNYQPQTLLDLLLGYLDESVMERVRVNALNLISELIQKDNEHLFQEDSKKIFTETAKDLAKKYNEAALLISTSSEDKPMRYPETKNILTLKEIITSEVNHTTEEIIIYLETIIREVETSIDIDLDSTLQFIFNNSIYGSEEELQKIGFKTLKEIIELLSVKLEDYLDAIITNLIRCYLFPKRIWNDIEKVLKLLIGIFTPNKLVMILIPLFKVFKPPILQNSLRVLGVVIKSMSSIELSASIQVLSEDLLDVF